MSGLRAALALPAVYRRFQALIGGGSRERYVRDHLRPVPGLRVFDIGCGPGEFAALLPAAEYTGLDLSAAYIEAARAKFGDRARFICGDVSSTELEGEAGYDLVTANGVLHHLPDHTVRGAFALANRLLRPGGRFVSIDPAFVAGQSRIARILARMDRGLHVRNAEEYAKLAVPFFSSVAPVVRHDLLRVPYTHVILECSTGARE